ncbi:hypothetical protein BBJ28_00017685 [Nothophytophthora sp. Chile5]|nr:hypothetical protein BBJ28_00017685 [Nothophytophthora sp. Chile5]
MRTGGFRRRRVLGVPVAAVVAACACFCFNISGVLAFADVGEASASGSACNNTKTTVFTYGDETSASSLAAQVSYADCSSEVVEATTDSNGNAQLNLSGKQIVNIASLPIAASSALTTLLNFSFPDTVVTLNFSNNPVTHIAGVTFPTSLKVLVITSTVGIQEFEIRQTDAALFMVLDTFNSSATTGVTCSDSVALHRYVQNTLLCVLDDDAFESKYHGTQESSSDVSGSGANTPAPVLDETIQQNRSKFLILSAVALVAAFVALMCALFVRSVHERHQRKNRRPVAAARSGQNTGRGMGGSTAGILRFYTDDSPGLKIGPTTVLVMCLMFVGFVVLLHVWGKFRG